MLSRDDFEDWVSEHMGEAVRRMPRKDKMSIPEWIAAYATALRALAPDEEEKEDDEYADDDDDVPELDFGS